MLDTTLAAPQRHGPLAVFPLVAADPVELAYDLLVDALDRGTLRITEVGSGTVPELFAVSEGDHPVLILDGEQLIGARQNRMTNRSILLPAHGKTRLPVSCMEQGRWHSVGEQFGPSPQHSPSRVRRQARQVEAEYALHDLDVPQEALSEAQGGVWGAIAEQAAELDARSDTGALDGIYQARTADIESWIADFPPLERQVGVVAFLGDEPLGMDLIGGPALYARLHDRLLRGYILDALGARPGDAGDDPEHAQRFLHRVQGARRAEAATVGKGSYRVLAGEVIGGELVHAGRVVHVSAFPAAAPRRGGPHVDAREQPVASPRQRRRSKGQE